MRCYRSTNMAACLVSDRLVFLDLPGDRYFCLEPRQDGAARDVRRESLAEGAVGSDRTAWHVLASEDFSPVEIEAVSASVIDTILPTPSRSNVAAALLRNAQALFDTTIMPLERIVARVARRRQATAARQAPPRCGIAELVAAHLASHRLLSAHDRCLPFSIALTGHLRRAHYAVDLVIGVRLDPFAAHAWVQRDGMVLNDRLEHARSFYPILVA